MSSTPERWQAAQHWLRRSLGVEHLDIRPASSDASFRRYYRVAWQGETRILMDAPPDREDSRQFVRVARALRAIGLNVPEVLQYDLDRGFLLLTDLGSRSYLQALDERTAERLYGDALGALIVLQACGPLDTGLLPAYDHARLSAEMALFRDWFLTRHLALELSEVEQIRLEQGCERLAREALAQPRVPVHRDYHSRNLMLTETHSPGILDFQDAVVGPVTYDLVSLLRDCYIAWPHDRVEQWVLGYHQLARQSGVLHDEAVGEAQFLRWFDLMGVQRHLKAIGIFARLNARDGKPGYLADIPRTLDYVVEVSRRYPELRDLYGLLVDRVLPRLAQP